MSEYTVSRSDTDTDKNAPRVCDTLSEKLAYAAQCMVNARATHAAKDNLLITSGWQEREEYISSEGSETEHIQQSSFHFPRKTESSEEITTESDADPTDHHRLKRRTISSSLNVEFQPQGVSTAQKMQYYSAKLSGRNYDTANRSEPLNYRAQGYRPNANPEANPFASIPDPIPYEYNTRGQRYAHQSRQSPAQFTPYSRPHLYSKLSQSEVRLIRIRPSRSSVDLNLSLVPTSLQKPPPYTALSYAWGDSTTFVEVEVNGHPHQITANLHDALKSLRASHMDVLCWADALSINQKNKEEVTAQVQMMREIYGTARSVTVWLGRSFEDSDTALELLDSISANTAGGNDGSLRRLIDSPESRRGFKALVSLFERDYWRRLWVVQEVLNAKYVTVVCGNSSMPWVTYERASASLRRLSSHVDRNYASWLVDDTQPLYISSKSRLSYSEVFLQLGPASFKDVASLSSSSDQDTKAFALRFQKLLCMCRSKFATDPRDKVYGLLGVAAEEVQEHIVPDYNLPIQEVFTKATEYIISATKRLDVLGNAFHSPLGTTSLRLPSWVPDWSHVSPMTPIDWPVGRFTAGAGEDSTATLNSKEHRLLSFDAIRIDSVGRRGIPVGSSNTADDFIMSFVHWYAMLQGHLKTAEESQKLHAEEAFCRILVLDNIHPLFTSPDVWRRVTLYLFASLASKNLPELVLHPRLVPFAKKDCVDLHGVSRNAILQESFFPGMTGRSFFLIKSGTMGMGGGYSAAGDTVVVPFGCNTPLLLRSDGGHDKYRFVSDAYLDGYMYGRAINEWESGKCKPERFTVH